MNRAFRTQTSHDFGRRLTEIADHVMCTRGCHWPISLAAIDSQGQMLWLTLKTDRAGIMEHDPPEVGDLQLPHCSPMHPPRRWRRNLQRYMVQPYSLGTCARRSCHETRPMPTAPGPTLRKK